MDEKSAMQAERLEDVDKFQALQEPKTPNEWTKLDLHHTKLARTIENSLEQYSNLPLRNVKNKCDKLLNQFVQIYNENKSYIQQYQHHMNNHDQANNDVCIH